MQRPLIIGYEDTAEGRDALALGAQLAEALDAKPLIATVVVLPKGVLTVGAPTAPLTAEAAGGLAEPLEQLARLEPEGEALAGSSAARALNELAESRTAVAAVVGSSDRATIGRLVLGGTAEQLLHGAPFAVGVAARGYAAAGTRPLRLGVAFDGSTEAALALQAGVKIARRCNSTLSLLTVVQTVSSSYSWAGASAAPAAEFQASEERRMRSALDRGLGWVPDGLPAHGKLLHGEPGEALVEVSENFDLIVIGSRDYGPLMRTLLGSSSRKLFKASRCSVLALPRGTSSGPLTGDEQLPDIDASSDTGAAA